MNIKNTGRVAIMQPYVFPYLGYFHLIEASSQFVFYDDVHYIRNGWINRNRILNQGAPLTFTIPVRNASQNALIMDTQTCMDARWERRFFTQLTHAYGKAPYFDGVIELIRSVIGREPGSIADLCIASITGTCAYLGIERAFTTSSRCSPDTRGMEKAARLIAITRALGSSIYLNSPGGKALYSKAVFRASGIELLFVNSTPVEYRQFGAEFVPALSIIDTLMFNDPATIRHFLQQYQLD